MQSATTTQTGRPRGRGHSSYPPPLTAGWRRTPALYPPALYLSLLMALLFGFQMTTTAQLVPCANSVMQKTATSFTATLTDDAVVNCDMLQVDNSGNTLKAIAYGRRFMPLTSPGTGAAEANVYCEDWAGNSLIINLPTGASRPDVALADGPVDKQGGTDVFYRVAVVYQIKTQAYIDIYELRNAGSSSFAATNPVSMYPLNGTSHNCDTFHNGPHIDMWSDANNLNPSSGLPTMHEFAVVWAQDPSAYSAIAHPVIVATDLYFMKGDVNISPTSSSWPRVALGPDAYFPDVACVTDVSSGDLLMELVFCQASAVPYDLRQAEYNFTSPPTTSVTSLGGSTTIDQGEFFSPRIEAMSQYDNTAGTVKWQAVASKGGFAISPLPYPPGGPVSGFYVFGYNSATSSTNLSGTSFIFPYNDSKSPCVAAGISPAFSGDLGNQQYTMSFFPHTRAGLYNRSISPSTGTEDSRWWEVNDTIANPVVYDWDAARSTAVSNCSNSGLNLMTAWFDGTNIVYKESPNTMSYRQTPASTGGTALSSHVTAWPIPVKDVLHVNGADAAAYSICDIAGKSLIQGRVPVGGKLDMQSLPAGLYIVRLCNTEGNTRSLKLSKQ